MFDRAKVNVCLQTQDERASLIRDLVGLVADRMFTEPNYGA